MLNTGDSQSMKRLPSASGSQGSNEVMFLKRLLFLKASLDNEGSLHSQPVQLDEKKNFKAEALSETQMANTEFASD